MVRVIVAALGLALSWAAHAQYLVDTGTPTGRGAYSLGDIQSLAGTFSLSSSSNITGAEIFLNTSQSQVFDTDLTVSLFRGDPGGELLFEQTFNVTAQPGWLAIGGLSWAVAAGNYAIAFGSSTTGNILGANFPAPNPLPLWSLIPADGNGWTQYPNDPGFGLRVVGESVAAIPEPETYGLLLAGILALGATRKRSLRQGRSSGASALRASNRH